MKLFLILMMTMVVSATSLSAQGSATESADHAAVRTAVSQYLQAHATGSGEPIRGVFHPELKLFYVRDGKFMQRTGADYIAGFSGTPAADEAQRKRRIELIDVSGNAAIAKVVLDYPTTTFTDYFTLLKIDGAWQIMNKTFNATPKAR